MLARHRTANELGDGPIIERLELHHAAAADERRVHLEVGVLGSSADEDDDAVLNCVKQGVLLGAAEAVDLVNEQDCAHATRHEAALCRVDLAAEVLDRARDGADLHELRVRGVGDDAGKGGLARAGGPVENHAREHVVLNGATQPRAGPHGLPLAHVLGKRLGAHAHGERGIHVALVALDFREESIHSEQSSELLAIQRNVTVEIPSPPIANLLSLRYRTIVRHFG